MNLFKSFAIAFSMYSKIPMPTFSWKTKEVKVAIVFFPLVGTFISFAQVLLFYFAKKYSLPTFTLTGFLFALPLIVTGGIHADGFIDTSDALSAYCDTEKKLEILKDPHVGAFAIIRFFLLCILLLSFEYYIAFRQDIDLKTIAVWAMSFTLSRILSGISVELFPKAKKSVTVNTFASENFFAKTCLLIILFLEFMVLTVLMLFLNSVLALFILSFSLLSFAYYYFLCKKNFNGTSGDLCGWFLCLCELLQTLSCCIYLCLCR